jgi:Cu/Ag efflux protein CusF
VRIFLSIVVLALLVACSRNQEAIEPEHQYALSGKVVALDPQGQTATVNAAAIPNFMDAMTMDYPVKSKDDFKKLHIGDQIKATVNVASDGRYDLSGIQIQNGAK